MNVDNPDEDNLPLRDSKSKRKRDMTALQKMGEMLVNLPAAELAKIPLDESLADAIHAARALTKHLAKRRQLQYIGRLMRNIDPQPIQEALEKIQGKNQQSKAHFHQLERWRNRLIAEGDGALEEFINLFPNANSQHLRQLIRKTQKDIANHQNTGASTELFRYLRELVGFA